MAYSVIWTADAKHDLDRIVSYYAEVLGMPKAASQLIDRMAALATTLSTFPQAHEFCRDEVLAARGYRKIIVNSNIILYLVDDTMQEVIVTNIFSGGQNYSKLL